jgi:peptidoglycan hydrolase-like protein with peptidoglycan-binding domain
VSRRRPGRRGWLAAAAAVLVVAAGASAWAVTRGDDTPTAQSLATATARRATLTQTVDASFALAKDGTSTLASPAAGTVTSVAITQGKAVKALTKLAGVDGNAVYGIPSGYPLYRGLAEGDEGPDVTALQKALAAAGYDPGEADGDFGTGTADALADWQADHGLEETGRLDLASFVSYKPGAVVDDVTVKVGDRMQAGGKLATLAPTQSLVATADVSQLDVAKLKVGQRVTLTFDALDGAATSGTVDEIADSPTSSDSSAGTTTVVQYPVTVRIGKLPTGARTGMTGQASVVTTSRRNVVVVPSSAIGGTIANPTVQVVRTGPPSPGRWSWGSSPPRAARSSPASRPASRSSPASPPATPVPSTRTSRAAAGCSAPAVVAASPAVAAVVARVEAPHDR